MTAVVSCTVGKEAYRRDLGSEIIVIKNKLADALISWALNVWTRTGRIWRVPIHHEISESLVGDPRFYFTWLLLSAWSPFLSYTCFPSLCLVVHGTRQQWTWTDRKSWCICSMLVRGWWAVRLPWKAEANSVTPTPGVDYHRMDTVLRDDRGHVVSGWQGGSRWQGTRCFEMAGDKVIQVDRGHSALGW